MKLYYVGIVVLSAMVVKIISFRDITVYSLLEVNQHFGGTCLHLQGLRIDGRVNQVARGAILFLRGARRH
jgi:hypothetical protein